MIVINKVIEIFIMMMLLIFIINDWYLIVNYILCIINSQLYIIY